MLLLILCLMHRWTCRLVWREMGIYASRYPQYGDPHDRVSERESGVDNREFLGRVSTCEEGFTRSVRGPT